MGTNYYSVPREALGTLHFSENFWDLKNDPENDILHIGKSSGGWCFSLHVIPDRGINSLGTWVPIFIDPERAIVDEYLDEIDWEQMMRTITARGRKEPCNWDHERYERNYAEPGPNNLARHSIGHGCIEHGPGTWDLIEGNFS